MAEKDRDDALDKLSLDKPRLFGRRRSRTAPASAPELALEQAADVAPEPEPVVGRDQPAAAGPDPAPPTREPEPVAAPLPVDDTRRFAPPEPQPEPAVPAVNEAEPAPEPERVAPAVDQAPGSHAAPVDETPVTRRSGARAGALASLTGGLRRRVAGRRSTGSETNGEPRERWTPPVAGVQAVAVVGLAIGILVYGLSVGTLKACEAVRGTASCGSAGYLYLLAILVVAALVGGWALDRCSIPDPRGTALLAVGIIAVVVLLILVPALFSWTMVLVIPLVATLAFLGSHAIAGVDLDAGERWQPEDEAPAASTSPVVTPPAQADRHDAGLGGRP